MTNETGWTRRAERALLLVLHPPAVQWPQRRGCAHVAPVRVRKVGGKRPESHGSTMGSTLIFFQPLFLPAVFTHKRPPIAQGVAQVKSSFRPLFCV